MIRIQAPSNTVGLTQNRKVSLSTGEQHSSHSAYESNLSAGKQPLAELSGARARKSTPHKVEEVMLASKGVTSQQPETSREQTYASSGSIETIAPLSGKKNRHKQKKWQKPIQNFFRKTSSKILADIKSREQHPIQDPSSKYSAKKQVVLSKKHTEALAVVAPKFSPQTSKECQKFHKYCRHYILKGKGSKVLTQCLSPTVASTMKQGLPDIPEKYFLHNYPSAFVRFNETHRMTDATHIPAQKAETKEQNLEDSEAITETAMISFNPKNERHKAMIILSRLNDMYRSVSQAITERVGLLDDIDESTRLLEQLETLQDTIKTIDKNILALMHALMKSEWPEYFSDGSYQHVVIIDDQGKSCLNLDSFQPRGGYLDQEPLTPVGPL